MDQTGKLRRIVNGPSFIHYDRRVGSKNLLFQCTSLESPKSRFDTNRHLSSRRFDTGHAVAVISLAYERSRVLVWIFWALTSLLDIQKVLKIGEQRTLFLVAIDRLHPALALRMQIVLRSE